MTKNRKTTPKTPNKIDVSAFPEQTVRDNTLETSKVLVTRDEFSTTVTYSNKPDHSFEIVDKEYVLPKVTQIKNGKKTETGKMWYHYSYKKGDDGMPTDVISSLIIDSFVDDAILDNFQYFNKKGEKKNIITKFWKPPMKRAKRLVRGDKQIEAFRKNANINNELCLFTRSN